MPRQVTQAELETRDRAKLATLLARMRARHPTGITLSLSREIQDQQHRVQHWNLTRQEFARREVSNT